MFSQLSYLLVANYTKQRDSTKREKRGGGVKRVMTFGMFIGWSLKLYYVQDVQYD